MKKNILILILFILVYNNVDAAIRLRGNILIKRISDLKNYNLNYKVDKEYNDILIYVDKNEKKYTGYKKITYVELNDLIYTMYSYGFIEILSYKKWQKYPRIQTLYYNFSITESSLMKWNGVVIYTDYYSNDNIIKTIYFNEDGFPLN